MEATAAPVKHTRRIVKPRKFDTKKVLSLAAAGMSASDIARAQSVNQSTIFRFLQTAGQSCHSRDLYRQHRAQVFADIQAQALDVQARILASFDDGVLQACKPSEKAMVLNSINNVFGTLFDKERLENGQSVSNISVVSRMIDGQIANLHKKAPDPAPNEGETSHS